MRIITLLFLIFLVSCSSRLDRENMKELIIVGTVHFPTDNVNADSITNVLERIKPDCILVEVDSANFNSDFTFKRIFDENEYNAIVKYKESYPEVDIRPIEFEGRNEYRRLNGLYSEAGPTFRILNELNRANKFNDEEQMIWDDFVKYWQQGEDIGTKNLKTINSSETDEVMDSSKLYQYVNLKTIIETHEEFNDMMLDAKGDSISMQDYFTKWSQFEYVDRNNAMTQNVIRTINSYPNEHRFVLLVGFHHRFHIKKQLENNNLGIKIKEFYEE